MSDVLETLYHHVSVREYTDQKVDETVLNQILKAACSGSTMGNMQLFSIIVTEDDEMKRKMAPFHFNQPMATQAPLILTFCADFRRFNRYCEFRDAETEAYSNLQSYHWAVTDALIAAQNACVAAESLGLGFCWLGTITYNADKFHRSAGTSPPCGAGGLHYDGLSESETRSYTETSGGGDGASRNLSRL